MPAAIDNRFLGFVCKFLYLFASSDGWGQQLVRGCTTIDLCYLGILFRGIRILQDIFTPLGAWGHIKDDHNTR